MSGALDGNVALVTGGASGIGRAVVDRFVREGAHVGVLDISEHRLQVLEKDLGDAVVGIHGDVRDQSAHHAAVETTRQRFSRVNVLVGNAAVFDGFVGLDELPSDRIDEAFAELFEVNVKGYLLAAKAALTHLRQASGSIIFTVSNAGFYPGGGGPLYTATKHAVVGLVKQLAFELAPGIRVNGVAPGGTLTDLRIGAVLSGLRNAVDCDEKARLIADRNPLGIAARPEDHVGAYVLLASSESRVITGTIINSDGGLGVRGLDR